MSTDFDVWNNDVCIEDIEKFYSLDGCFPTDDFPFLWTMSVSSFDNIIAFRESSIDPGSDSKTIALQCLMDWKLLNACWMQCDASVVSGSCVRDEPNLLMSPSFPEMIEWRKKNGKSIHPLQVILTGSGDINLNHILIQKEEYPVLIATTIDGKDILFKNYKNLTKNTSTIEFNDFIEVNNEYF